MTSEYLSRCSFLFIGVQPRRLFLFFTLGNAFKTPVAPRRNWPIISLGQHRNHKQRKTMKIKIGMTALVLAAVVFVPGAYAAGTKVSADQKFVTQAALENMFEVQ